MTSAAIYFQKSKVVQEEFKLIELTTVRELYVEQLKNIIDAINDERRKEDDENTLEQFTLFNKIRASTIDLIRAISVWQESFTKPLRPQLMECDYIVVKMIRHMDILNGTKLRRTFNFQFLRGNTLLLPFPNPKTIQPIKVSPALGEQIHMFANPNEEDLIYCYQFLINCLPDDIYANRLASLNKWLIEGWIPRVWISDTIPKLKRSNTGGSSNHSSTRNQRNSTLHSFRSGSTPTHRGSSMKQSLLMCVSSTSRGTSSSTGSVVGTPKHQSESPANGDAATRTSLPSMLPPTVGTALTPLGNVLITSRGNSGGRSRRLLGSNSNTNRIISGLSVNTQAGNVGGTDNSEPESHMVHRSSSASRSTGMHTPGSSNRRSTGGLTPNLHGRRSGSSVRSPSVHASPSAAGSRKSSASQGGRKSNLTPKSPQRQRRNQLLRKDADQILTMTGHAALEQTPQLPPVEENTENPVSREVEVVLNDEEKQELEKLDLYYKEMENLFIPKYNRRRVQTMVLTGADIAGPDDGVDFQYTANKTFDQHTNKGTVEILNKAMKGDQSEKFKRTDGNLIAKRNRIIADRNNVLIDNKKQYTAVNSLYTTTSRPNSAIDGDDRPDSPTAKELRKQLGEESDDDEDEEEDYEGEVAGGNGWTELQFIDEDEVLRVDDETADNDQLVNHIRRPAGSGISRLSATRRRASSASRRLSDLSVTFSADNVSAAPSAISAETSPTATAAAPSDRARAVSRDTVLSGLDSAISGGTPNSGSRTSTRHNRPAPLKPGLSHSSFATASSNNSSNIGTSGGHTPKAALDCGGGTKPAKTPRSKVKAIADFSLSTAEMRIQFMRQQRKQQALANTVK